MTVVFAVIFVRIEIHKSDSFVDFNIFRNLTYTGATLSNFLLNATAGVIVVAMSLMQIGAGWSAQEAGYLTLGYAIAIVAFIRVGEKLLQRLGPRKPMLWGAMIVGGAILLLMQTYLSENAYMVLAFIAFSMVGLGLAFYATPSTDAALSALDSNQAGMGAGIYKMASSLGASFGVAISATVFTLIDRRAESTKWVDGVISFEGRQDNLVTREAAMAAMAVNFLMLIAAVVTILVTIPGKTDEATDD